MNYGVIKKTDVANGPGIRVSLFVSGCTHHCKGCFNSETWDFGFGKLFTDETIEEILTAMEASYISGFSVLGGEPFEQKNQKEVLKVIKAVRQKFPQKTIWCYSGYTYETDIREWIRNGNAVVADIIKLIDVLVDGEFVEEKKNLSLLFRGSENQRLIDVPKSLEQDYTVLYQE